MKNLIFTAALLLAAITTATAQSLKVGNVTVTYNVKRLCAGGDFSTEAELKNQCSTYYKCFIVVRQPHLHKTDVRRCFSSGRKLIF